MSASAHVARPLIYKYSTAVTRIESTDEPATSILSSHFIIDIGVYLETVSLLTAFRFGPLFSLRMLLIHPFGRKMHEKKKEKDSHWVVCDDLGFFFSSRILRIAESNVGVDESGETPRAFASSIFILHFRPFFFFCVRCMRPPTFLRMEQDFRGVLRGGVFLSCFPLKCR